jgi:hypothetical protein
MRAAIVLARRSTPSRRIIATQSGEITLISTDRLAHPFAHRGGVDLGYAWPAGCQTFRRRRGRWHLVAGDDALTTGSAWAVFLGVFRM